MTSPDLRLELRAKNNVLWHAIMDLYPSVAEFCRIHNLDNGRVGALLTLKLSPYGKTGPLRLATELCEISGLDIETLFPSKLYTDLIPRKIIAEVSSERFVSLQAARQIALPPSQEDRIESGELSDALSAALKTLTPREERVIRERFGMDDEPRTLDDVGVVMGIHRERVRQIEAKALRKLRHRSRAQKLKPFVEPRYSVDPDVIQRDHETANVSTRQETPPVVEQPDHTPRFKPSKSPMIVHADTDPESIAPHAFIGVSPFMENGTKRYGWWCRVVLRSRAEFIAFDPNDSKYAPAESLNSRITHVLVPTTPHGVNGIYIELQGTAEPKTGFI